MKWYWRRYRFPVEVNTNEGGQAPKYFRLWPPPPPQWRGMVVLANWPRSVQRDAWTRRVRRIRQRSWRATAHSGRTSRWTDGGRTAPTPTTNPPTRAPSPPSSLVASARYAYIVHGFCRATLYIARSGALLVRPSVCRIRVLNRNDLTYILKLSYRRIVCCYFLLVFTVSSRLRISRQRSNLSMWNFARCHSSFPMCLLAFCGDIPYGSQMAGPKSKKIGQAMCPVKNFLPGSTWNFVR